MEPFHYPTELLNLLSDAVPMLVKGKRDTVLFFTAAGVPDSLTSDLAQRVKADRNAIGKREIAQTILVRLNLEGDRMLAPRRELLKRVVEFESFQTCYPENVIKAKGLIADIAKLIRAKDTFTRIDEEREREAAINRADKTREAEVRQRRSRDFALVKSELFALFGVADPHKRGKAAESVLNRLFQLDGLLVREAFTLQGDEGQGIVEQIDGALALDGDVYLAEMKWWASPIGKAEVSPHLVNIFSRAGARGIFISTSGFTPAAVATCKDALAHRVVILVELEEIVKLLEEEADLAEFVRAKVKAAVSEKNPLVRPLGAYTR